MEDKALKSLHCEEKTGWGITEKLSMDEVPLVSSFECGQIQMPHCYRPVRNCMKSQSTIEIAAAFAFL